MLLVLTITMLVLTLGSAQLTVNISSECQCEKKTLHQQFCDDHFVITVILLEHTPKDDNGNERKYESFVLTNHKGNKNIKQWTMMDLYTNATSATCGLTLIPFHHYILGVIFVDGKPWISLCNLVVYSFNLPCMTEDYKNCDCKIIYEKCKANNCPDESDSCTYTPKDGNGWGYPCLRDNTDNCKWKECHDV